MIRLIKKTKQENKSIINSQVVIASRVVYAPLKLCTFTDLQVARTLLYFINIILITKIIKIWVMHLDENHLFISLSIS